MRRFPLFLLATAATAALGYGTWFGSLQYRATPIIAGDSYRSGQLSASSLEQVIERHQIRSIINLRGANYDKAWYQDEVTLAKNKEIAHFDFALSSKRRMTGEQKRQLLAMLDNAPRPMLIHCNQGIERTNEAVNLYLAQEKNTHPASLSLSQNVR